MGLLLLTGCNALDNEKDKEDVTTEYPATEYQTVTTEEKKMEVNTIYVDLLKEALFHEDKELDSRTEKNLEDISLSMERASLGEIVRAELIEITMYKEEPDLYLVEVKNTEGQIFVIFLNNRYAITGITRDSRHGETVMEITE